MRQRGALCCGDGDEQPDVPTSSLSDAPTIKLRATFSNDERDINGESWPAR